jgi:hypothetical protein
MACVIPFPVMHQGRQKADPYALFTERLLAILDSEAADPAPSAPPPALCREEEILKLLRRIDRRLARLGAV